MKSFLQLFVITFFVSAFLACNNTPEGQTATTEEATATAEASTDAKTLAVDLGTSTIHWEGTKPGGAHTGTIKLKEGSFSVKGGNIESGKFVIDMNTIENTDMEGDMKASLEAHLKGTRSAEEQDDFFNVADYPTATFEIATLTPIEGDTTGLTHSIKGNLTMKDTTYSVTFPTKISMDENGLSAKSAKFKIDRTKWGITFKSPTALNLKEKFVNDEIGLQIELNAK